MSIDALFSKLNPLVVAILRSRLHGPLSRALLLLTVTGRRTERRYTIPVGYQRDGETLFVLVSEARRKQWWRNYAEPRPVTLRLRGRERNGTAVRLSPDAPVFRARAEATLGRVPGMARVFGVDFDRAKGLDEAQAAHLGREIAIVRIDLG